MYLLSNSFGVKSLHILVSGDIGIGNLELDNIGILAEKSISSISRSNISNEEFRAA